MWKNEFCLNVNKEFTEFTVFPNEKKYNQMITSEAIEFSSICSHHFVNFSGLCWLGYIPDQLIIGKSKISRLVEFYSRKPQIQEGLTHEILNCFVKNVKPVGCIVVMKAIHNCEYCRGARKHAPMTTSAIHGNFSQIQTRTEFFQLINLPHSK
jgi:GTP cyclohydrolase I